jgi:predicted glycoside hydrolase/deacetylase ChbG (UPF0249 family)
MQKNIGVILCVLVLGCLCLAANSQAQQKTIAQRLGYPADSRLLIIHADDFAMMHSVDRATEEAFENHWITSASIMVPCPWYPEVARWAKSHPDADLGIHLTLNADWTPYRWGPVSPQPRNSSLLDADGYLPLLGEYVVKHAKMSDVEQETHAQIDKAKASGITLSHFDSHMGTIVSSKELLGVYLGLGESYKTPLLLAHGFDTQGVELPQNAVVLDGVLEILPGVPKSEWQATYRKLLAALPPGAYQLIVHLAYDDEEMRGATFDHPDWGAAWRQNDFDMLRDPEFQKFLKEQKFILVSWKDLGKLAAQK